MKYKVKKKCVFQTLYLRGVVGDPVNPPGCAYNRGDATVYNSRKEALDRLMACGWANDPDVVLVRIKPKPRCGECGRVKR